MLEYLGEIGNNFGAHGSRYISPATPTTWDSFLGFCRLIFDSGQDATLSFLAGLTRSMNALTDDTVSGLAKIGATLVGIKTKSFNAGEKAMKNPTHLSSILALTSLGASLGVGGYMLASALIRKAKSRYLFRQQAAEYAERRIQVIEGREARIAADSPFLYVETVAAQVNLKLGGIPKTTAERAAAQRLAYRIMRNDNHRYVHIARDMPIIMALILTPTILQQQRSAYERAMEFGLDLHDYPFSDLVIGEHGDLPIDALVPKEE
jgi:hypothetical protein